MTALSSSGSAVVTLPSDTEILIEREFDAPKHLVYRAWTSAELVKRWWAGTMGKVTIAEVDLRVGGKWRYVMVTDDGYEVAFNGVFSEIVPNERLVNTEAFEGMPDSEPAVNTITFTGTGARSKISVLVRHANREDRDAHINSGMEGGMQESMNALERVAISLA